MVLQVTEEQLQQYMASQQHTSGTKMATLTPVQQAKQVRPTLENVTK